MYLCPYSNEKNGCDVSNVEAIIQDFSELNEIIL